MSTVYATAQSPKGRWHNDTGTLGIQALFLPVYVKSSSSDPSSSSSVSSNSSFSLLRSSNRPVAMANLICCRNHVSGGGPRTYVLNNIYPSACRQFGINYSGPPIHGNVCNKIIRYRSKYRGPVRYSTPLFFSTPVHHQPERNKFSSSSPSCVQYHVPCQHQSTYTFQD